MAGWDTGATDALDDILSPVSRKLHIVAGAHEAMEPVTQAGTLVVADGGWTRSLLVSQIGVCKVRHKLSSRRRMISRRCT